MKSGWQTKRLGDVCSFAKAQGIYHSLPYIGLEHIESDTGRFIGSLDPQPVKSSTFRFSTEHVLYGRLRPYLNKVFIPDFEGHCSTEIFPIKPSPLVSREYLFNWLISAETMEQINRTCTGARMPRADMNEVLDFEFPLPPLPEQGRIVGMLDKAFAALATAVANTEKNLQNARALFESHLNTVFSFDVYEMKKGWETTRLGDTCEVVAGQSPEGKFYNSEGKGLPFYQGKKDFGEKFIDNPTTWTTQITKVAIEGDILMSVRAPVGPVNFSTGKICIGRGLAAIRCGENIDRDFLFYQMLNFQPRIAGKEGAVFASINKAEISALPIMIAPLAEQRRIVKELNALSTETQRVTRLYEQKQAALAEVKKSLLHQAFAGEL